MSAPGFQYDIEGELVTLDQIMALATREGLARATVKSRLHYGDRTWARLLRKVDLRAVPKNRLSYGRHRGERRLPKPRP